MFWSIQHIVEQKLTQFNMSLRNTAIRNQESHQLEIYTGTA